MPFSHIGLPVGDHFAEMRDFYKAILQPLGYEIVVEAHEPHSYCGFGVKGAGPDFWLGGGCADGLQKYDGELKSRVAPIHVAFDGKNREHVDEWYEVAIKAGATDNGKPGIRKEYMPGYYGAFVLDPLGNNIEVVHLTF
ncbi:Glyoxalase/Bleomycin resistance protein/Dihydroxybiphenyl dioxygenase [Dactylonectria estremocensis]|uniref:Glyoxalase/Bleomycin resistance protein/Dihydroxybiphenyl dioxygenase n=1 Tax=Dactylonectria estremocensis TaxID=1079267 RepID=A0A9P9EZL2_9HYPO|nr:Glyoxalase/Bleomycin resistance protein/Dihydroxybiphenyl dioxygenase [Dactylonectria estremocensis]